jgi:hypothetical protein
MTYFRGCGGTRRHGSGIPEGSERLSAPCNCLGGRFDGYFLIFSFALVRRDIKMDTPMKDNLWTIFLCLY